MTTTSRSEIWMAMLLMILAFLIGAAASSALAWSAGGQHPLL
ncbi:MAG TPA: hypothetical protein VH583_05680 [Vicinamibacterales bacterium]|jgi:uncharacterized membrane protein YoaK (UPF0700 family)